MMFLHYLYRDCNLRHQVAVWAVTPKLSKGEETLVVDPMIMLSNLRSSEADSSGEQNCHSGVGVCLEGGGRHILSAK